MRSYVRLFGFAFVSTSLSIAAFATGCSSSSGGGTTSGTPIPKAQFEASFGAAYCDNIGACCTAAGYGYDAASCKSLFSQQLASMLADPAIVYDANAAGACVDAAKAGAARCFDAAGELAFMTACQKVFVGTLPEGATCQHDEECAQPAGADGVNCDSSNKCVVIKHGKAGDGCNGTCTKRSDGSTECFSSSPTGGGGGGSAVCWTGDALYCADDGTCHAQVKLGDACSYGGCVSGTYCGTNGTCVALVAAGGACNSNDECASGLACDSTQKCSAPKADGQTCVTSSECASDNCDSTSKTCKARNYIERTMCGGATPTPTPATP